MASFSLRKHVDAPPEIVFELVSDFEHMADNVSGIERVELLTDGAVGVGTRFRETRIMFGKEATEEMEVTAFDSPHGYTLESQSCGCHFRAEHQLIADIAGTHVRLNITSRPVTLLAKLMSPLALLMTGPMKRCIEADLEDLRAAAETKSRQLKQADA